MRNRPTAASVGTRRDGASEKTPQGGSERHRRRRPRQSVESSRAPVHVVPVSGAFAVCVCVPPARPDRHNTTKQTKYILTLFLYRRRAVSLSPSSAPPDTTPSSCTRAPHGDDDYAYAARRPGAPTAKARPVVTAHCPERTRPKVYSRAVVPDTTASRPVPEG